MTADPPPAFADAPGPGERVRFCLQCGAVLAFSAERCSACGAAAMPAGGTLPPAPTRIRACPACGASMPAQLLFCPHCGLDVGAQEAPALRGPPPPEDDGGRSLDGLSITLSLLAPLVVALAIVEIVLSGR